MDYVFCTNNLVKKYGKNYALDHVSMHIPKGAVYGFVGKNGAGKTTMIRLMCGLQYPTEGEFTLLGISNSSGDIGKTRNKIGAMVETPALYMDMTARENLHHQFRILGLNNFDSIMDLLNMVQLQETGKKKVKHFSLGMKQKLGIAMALAGNPEFIILDEPTNGLDPQGIIELRDLITKLNQENKITFLISSHILDELSKLATHYGFIDHGRMIREMTADEVEKACQKSVRVEVNNTEILSKVLENKNIKYKIISDKQADIYDRISFTKLAIELAKEECEIFYCFENNENLEEFFINLVEGGTT